jgi:sigma-54 specific flagellar transcriptional regulator A
MFLRSVHEITILIFLTFQLLKLHLHDIEVSFIQQALEESNGVVAHAAKKLNMRRTNLVEKLKKLEL